MVQLNQPIHSCPYIRVDGTEATVEFYLLDNMVEHIGYQRPTPSGSLFYIVRDYYPQSMKLFDHLRNNLKWNNVDDNPYKLCLTKGERSIHCMGDHGESWESNCLSMRDNVDKELEVSYNSALLNLYSSGQDWIMYHSDRDSKGPIESVASISLGSSRYFYLRNNSTREVIRTEVRSGDMVVMIGVQSTHKHTIRWMPEAGSRISITLRKLR